MILKRDSCLLMASSSARRTFACRSNGETTFEQDIIKKSRCEVHVFDPTLEEAVAAQVRAIKGVTFHPYGLGAVDGVVSLLVIAVLMHRSNEHNRVAPVCCALHMLALAGHKCLHIHAVQSALCLHQGNN